MGLVEFKKNKKNKVKSHSVCTEHQRHYLNVIPRLCAQRCVLYSAATIQNNTAADQLPAADHVWSAAQESREKEANNCSKGEVFPLSPTGRQFCVVASQG